MLASISTIIMTVLFILNYLCVIFVVFFSRKNSSTTVSWVLVLCFLPIVGFILYLLFGSGLRFHKNKRYHLKERRDKEYEAVIHNVLKIPEQESPYGFAAVQRMYKYHKIDDDSRSNIINSISALGDGEEINFAESMKSVLRELNYEDIENVVIQNQSADSLIKYFYNADRSYYSRYNEVEIFTDGEELFQSILKDIEAATSSIHLLYYMIKYDDTGRELVELLTKKAREGVEVRLSYDRVGSLFSPKKMFKELVAAGGEVYPFFPFTVSITSYLRLNYRNHRKIIVIDGKVGYLGGANIADEYRNRGKRLKPWRDTHMRLTGVSVWFLQERFFMDWADASGKSLDSLKSMTYYAPVPEVIGTVGMQIVSSGPDTVKEEIKRGILKMIASSKSYIYLQSPYFIPDEAMLEALKVAALSGVDVRLMIPGIADKFFVFFTSMSYVEELISAGAKVYSYNGFIHSKTAVSDDAISTIGTTNLDIRSFVLDFEINAFMYDPKIAKQCKEIFLNDINSCYEITMEDMAQRGTLHKIAENFFRLFSPLM